MKLSPRLLFIALGSVFLDLPRFLNFLVTLGRGGRLVETWVLNAMPDVYDSVGWR